MLSTIETDIQMEKAQLRRDLAGLPFPSCAHLVSQFLALPQVEAAKTVLLFWSMTREPDTRPAISRLLALGKRVCLPKCLPGRLMEARQWTGDERLLPSGYGIPEPGNGCPIVSREDIDVILVPNLCCDRDNYRLGHGGGYYDRYLAGYKGLTVALCPGAFFQDRVPREGHDLPVGLVLTDA